MLKAWTTCWAPSFPSIKHILPEDDVIEHKPSQFCLCNPRKDFIQQGVHTTGVIWAHNAADGRS